MTTVVVDGIGFPLERRLESAPPCRPDAGERPRSAERVTESSLRTRLSELVQERQRLRERGVGHAELERNRIAIVEAQQELGRVLIAQHSCGA